MQKTGNGNFTPAHQFKGMNGKRIRQYNYWIDEQGQIWSGYTKKQVTPVFMGSILYVVLHHEMERKTLSVARLMLEVYKGMPYKSAWRIKHKDGNYRNVGLDNLQVITKTIPKPKVFQYMAITYTRRTILPLPTKESEYHKALESIDRQPMFFRYLASGSSSPYNEWKLQTNIT